MKFSLLSLFALLLILISCKDSPNNPNAIVVDSDYKTPFELGNGNQTTTYQDCIAFYQQLANDFSTVTIEEIGKTDIGLPLHVIHYSNSSINWGSLNENKIKILINNGIHPGESDGIDATMMLVRDLATGKMKVEDNVIFSTIAIYNVGGSLNRNTGTRTNQNGPESYGFRGNARNYDLNRDFIKADTRNTRAFAQIYHKIKPDIFIDNHVSNGADYQYTLTHLFTQHNRIGSATGSYIHNTFQPALEQALKNRSLDITPYVNVYNQSPDKGFSQFVDYPRYSTGYTALWNTIGFMVETHMLKPYNDRVLGTKAIMEEVIHIGSSNVEAIKKVRQENFTAFQAASYYPINFEVDESYADTLDFKGYEAIENVSELTGNKLMTYDRDQPFTRKTPFYTYMKATDSIRIPEYYVVPQGQWEVIELMRLNNIIMKPLEKDSTMTVGKYTMNKFNTAPSAYEGHYPHSNVKVQEKTRKVRFRESDILIPTAQPGIKYILETLEPAAPDSFFKWNYFDTILQQKEGYSAYVFEATARKMLEENESLRKRFDSMKRADRKFANSNRAQLSWLHDRSDNHEDAYLTYPIYKLN
ncbi:M14 family metallopeptidase [Nonlabens marinus]|uniref:Gll2474 protein n=1 Tax=Nonlabens marinus S1-08 TaxID=1454201 RepID=W8VP57_9FLAO|nr:M14 family metallopeptidase [Nonlabens marinus]BAO54265.1 gll2474 protein [Nonlabens marinus S1-08]